MEPPRKRGFEVLRADVPEAVVKRATEFADGEPMVIVAFDPGDSYEDRPGCAGMFAIKMGELLRIYFPEGSDSEDDGLSRNHHLFVCRPLAPGETVTFRGT